jgi:hypothetical protein
VTNDLDALLTALYVEIDDHVAPLAEDEDDDPDSATPSC